MGEDKILKAAFVVVKAMDKLADETLPKQIADVVKLHAAHSRFLFYTRFLAVPQ